MVSKRELKRLYITQNKTLKQLVDSTGRSKGQLRYWINKFNLTNLKSKRRKDEHIDLDKFTKIKDSDTAYVLGYLAWAGFKTYEDTYMISARYSQLASIKRLLKIFNIRNPIKVYNFKHGTKTYTKYYITISKRGLDKFISKWYYGHPHVKPFKFPPDMDKKYLPDYLRGYLERHTCVLNNKNGYCSFYVSTPYKAFNKQLLDTLKSFKIDGKIKNRKQLNGRTSYGVYLSNYSLEDLYQLLYSHSGTEGTYLERVIANYIYN